MFECVEVCGGVRGDGEVRGVSGRRVVVGFVF